MDWMGPGMLPCHQMEIMPMSRGGADDAVSWYERNASTGALTYGGMLKDGVGGVDGLTVHPSWCSHRMV